METNSYNFDYNPFKHQCETSHEIGPGVEFRVLRARRSAPVLTTGACNIRPTATSGALNTEQRSQVFTVKVIEIQAGDDPNALAR